MGDGFKEFKDQLKAWWPIIAALCVMAFSATVFSAKAESKIADHDDRLAKIEAIEPGRISELSALATQSTAIEKKVDRIEDKIDRLIENR